MTADELQALERNGRQHHAGEHALVSRASAGGWHVREQGGGVVYAKTVARTLFYIRQCNRRIGPWRSSRRP